MLRLNSSDELRIAIDELNGILDTDEEVPIVFSDEPDKTYYGEMEGVSEGIEVEGTHIVTITFFRSDPYKYGQSHKTIALKKFTWEEYAGQTWRDLIGSYNA